MLKFNEDKHITVQHFISVKNIDYSRIYVTKKNHIRQRNRFVPNHAQFQKHKTWWIDIWCNFEIRLVYPINHISGSIQIFDAS